MIYGLTRLGKTLDNFYEMLASVDKLGYLMDLPQEKTQGAMHEFSDSPYQVAIENLSLPGGIHLDALNNVNLQLAPGSQIVISGDTEKGSLFDVIFGLRQASSGRVSFNGHDLRDLNLSQLRNSVSLVRDAEIFTGTLLDNLCLGRTPTFTEVRQMLEQVGLTETIAQLPDSLQTVLLPSGAPLTQEQCLRLALARAMLGRPRLLLLDKVLDRIEPSVLSVILDYLLAPSSPWTLIVTSQRVDIIARFERQIKIDHGKLSNIQNGNQGGL